MVDTIQQLVAPEYLKMQSEVESRLAAIGLTPEDLSRRAHCVIEGGLTSYFFDDKLIVQSEISHYENIVTFTVRSFSHG